MDLDFPSLGAGLLCPGCRLPASTEEGELSLVEQKRLNLSTTTSSNFSASKDAEMPKLTKKQLEKKTLQIKEKCLRFHDYVMVSEFKVDALVKELGERQIKRLNR